MSATYTVSVAREGRWWIVTVPEVGGVTQARRFAEVGDMARELIAVTLGVRAESVTIRVELDRVGNVDVRSRLSRLRDDREQASRLEQQAAESARALARDLAAEGVSLRDVGAVLGVSHQRAHQLVSSA